MKNNNIIGVIGGMGPQATAEFYRILIEKSIREHGAVNNDDFPSVVIDSVPVPDFISSQEHLSQARAMLIDRTKRLNAYGVGRIGIACNTAHLLLNELRAVSGAPIVSIMDVAASLVAQKKITRVGLLASPMTYKTKLYQTALKNTATVITPNVKLQSDLDDLIRAVISGKNIKTLKTIAYPLIESFIRKQRVEAIILGCTELPLIVDTPMSVPTISSLDILADDLLTYYYGEKKEDI